MSLNKDLPTPPSTAEVLKVLVVQLGELSSRSDRFAPVLKASVQCLAGIVVMQQELLDHLMPSMVSMATGLADAEARLEALEGAKDITPVPIPAAALTPRAKR